MQVGIYANSKRFRGITGPPWWEVQPHSSQILRNSLGYIHLYSVLVSYFFFSYFFLYLPLSLPQFPRPLEAKSPAAASVKLVAHFLVNFLCFPILAFHFVCLVLIASLSPRWPEFWLSFSNCLLFPFTYIIKAYEYQSEPIEQLHITCHLMTTCNFILLDKTMQPRS